MNSSSFIWGNFIVFIIGIFIISLGTARLTAKIIQEKKYPREKFLIFNGAFLLACLFSIHLAYDLQERIQSEGVVGLLSLYALFSFFWAIFSKGEK